MKKITTFVTSMIHQSMDNALSNASSILTESMAKKGVDAMDEVFGTIREVVRVVEAEKKEFDSYAESYNKIITAFSGFVQAEIEKRFEAKK